ncbi:MAG: tRNA (adenosine(37)-N6)-threonylcarbamoyltransferase complex dimerization subunit type 1 TsaB [Gemmatimonadales bacterium]|nr:tRNA (adenosine(37)-N6)-threonylcarbamoyltransferase complex dimerization subunit type 1 TsaB [Gemmatimonadales bacterium]
MITLGIDTATDRCTVAVRAGMLEAERHLDGARGHATNILSLIDDACKAVGVTIGAVERIIVADGPGSFTGLRVGAAVAKALAWRREIDWHTAPSLLGRARRRVPPGGGVVLALADALRGELYAGRWEFAGNGVEGRDGFPRTVLPRDLAALIPVDVVVGPVPAALRAEIEAITGSGVIDGEPAMADARALIGLLDLADVTTRVSDIDNWEPIYGRPAEAQAVWERKHGRPLPTPPGIAR